MNKYYTDYTDYTWIIDSCAEVSLSLEGFCSETQPASMPLNDFPGRGAKVSSPKAVLKLVEVFKGLDKSMDRLQLVRVINRFNKESASLDGHRFVDAWS